MIDIFFTISTKPLWQNGIVLVSQSFIQFARIPWLESHWNFFWKKCTSGPRYWNVSVLVNTGTFLVYQYCLKMWYLRSVEHAGLIRKLTILERKKKVQYCPILVNQYLGLEVYFPPFFLFCFCICFVLFCFCFVLFLFCFCLFVCLFACLFLIVCLFVCFFFS